MNWNKAGRRRKCKDTPLVVNIDCSTHIDIKVVVNSTAQQEQVKSEPVKSEPVKPWTREELRIYKNGPAALARAVVEQWKADGMPDEPGIKPWIALVEQFEMEDNG